MLALRIEHGLLVSPSRAAGPQRVLPAVAVEHTGGTFAFAASVAGAPVTYSPCRSIRIRVDDRRMPARADGVVEEAVARVRDATGLDLRIVGGTTASPRTMRSLRSAQRPAGRAPVVVSWTTPREEPALAGDVTGVAASVRSAASSRPHYVTGAVSLDTRALRHFLALPGGRRLVRAVVMRELARLVGLEAVRDPRELMNRHNLGLTDFGPGDREGLALLGRGPCI